MDSCSPLSRGGVYTCGSRCRNDDRQAVRIKHTAFFCWFFAAFLVVQFLTFRLIASNLFAVEFQLRATENV
jgi:hypothetical protein